MRARPLFVSLISLVALTATWFAQSPAASAAMVTTHNDRDRSPAIYYAATPGERNSVALAYGDGETLTISDSGAVITASRRCRSIDAHTAVCPIGDVFSVHVAVGDLDDSVTPAQDFSENLIIYGGPGNDVLRGTDYRYGSDRLNGGGGQDQLYGGRGDDTLTDGDRDNAVGGAAPGPDTLDGGGGRDDTLSYVQRTEAVRARAGASANAGEPGEHDRIVGIESVVGGAGNDRLLGDRRDNALSGGAGHDVIVGRRGWDKLDGGRGEDRLFGGRGWDSVYGGAGIDAMTCGGGVDDAFNVRAREVLPRSCERVHFLWDDATRAWNTRTYPTTTQTWWLSLSTSCPGIWDEETVRCRGTIALHETRARHRLLARGHFSHAATGSIGFNVALAMTATG